MTLTDLTIKKLKPKSSRFEVSDGKGLFLRVMPSGKKAFVFRYYFEGRPRRINLGHYFEKPEGEKPGDDQRTALTIARTRHLEAIKDLENGIDPGVKLQEEKAKRKAAPTFKDLLDEFWEIELQFQPTGKARKRLIEKDVLDLWKNRKVTSITRRDAVVVLDDVRKRAPVGTNRLQGVLIRVFNFAAERGMIEHSPLTGMRRTKETARSRVLNNDEINLLWKGLALDNRDIDIYKVTKLALKAILLTGQRPGEVSSMRWDQLDGEFWTIPGEARKTGEGNKIPICPMFAEVIEQCKVFSSDSEYVFRSSFKDKKPVTRLAFSAAVRRHHEGMGIKESFVPHDLRRTLRTRLAEIGISDIVGERVLGHKLQGVLGIYNRHSYDIEKRQALALWEKRLKEILGLEEPETKVIRLDEVRRA